MTQPKVAPYGSWQSPITAEMAAAAENVLEQVKPDGEDLYWIERRPLEGGRKVIVRRSTDGETRDITPAPFNARTRVHEYGGGDYAVSRRAIVFANFADQRLYLQTTGADPKPLTPALPLRYADGVIDHHRGLYFCVREDHRNSGEPVNTLVRLNLQQEGPGEILTSGNDFYSSPRLAADGSKLAWLTWNHPNMPWDGTEVWAGKLNEAGLIIDVTRVAGGPNESICQPEWSPQGTLYFVSDRSGWWNLYRWRAEKVEPVCPMEAEFGEPQWVFGNSLYAFESETWMVCSYRKDGKSYLARLHTPTGALHPIELPYSALSQVRTNGHRVILIGASPTEPVSAISLDLRTGDLEVIRRSRGSISDAGYFSIPRAIEFPSENGCTAHGYFYPPANRDYVALPEEKPPLLVMTHGGPTSATSSSLRYAIQYWTSRGIAVLDVNYRGSSGYGRQYREQLKGRWGIVDVDDCVNGARHLVEIGQVNGNRLAIRGGSAGGYTTLCALTFRDVFKAGASHYGISDLEALARDTHKFESRYLDTLIGPYPERRDLYRKRSPIHYTDRLSCPMILFQGSEDKVVPPDQAEKMVEVVRSKGLPVAYIAFDGEQHGFRKAENIKRVLEAELYFYSRIFGFDLADPVEAVKIENFE